MSFFGKIKTEKKSLGSRGEDIAQKFLEQKGYVFVERNYHSRYGEIDLIMKEKGKLVFIEVKTRKNKNFGTAIEAITSQKIEKIYKTAQKYISEKINPSQEIDFRIDVVGIDYEGGKAILDHIPGIGWD